MDELDEFLKENCPNISRWTWLRWVLNYGEVGAGKLALGEAASWVIGKVAEEEGRIVLEENIIEGRGEDKSFVTGFVAGMLFVAANPLLPNECLPSIMHAAYSIDDQYLNIQSSPQRSETEQAFDPPV